MRVIGLISGTSLDAIDVAAAALTLRDGTIVLTPLGHAERAWPAALRARLLAALPPAAVSMGEVCRLDTEIGQAFGAAASWANQHLAEGRAELIASHGQNVFHWIENGRAQGTLQLGQPAWIAEATGLPVVSDFRAADVAAGGQGAPLASTLDALWLASPDGRKRAALNLGGIANITIVGRATDPVVAFDTGPANCLMDAEAARQSGGALASDEGGRIAAAGSVHPALLERLMAEPYYARPAPKSTGRELFDADYLDRHSSGLDVSGPDRMATLAALTAATVADACRRAGVVEVVASGGGVRNPVLMAALAQQLGPIQLDTAEARGLPSGGKEAYLFALLGFLSWNGLAGTVAGATGSAQRRILGRISPGRVPLVLPTPAAPPIGLVIDS